MAETEGENTAMFDLPYNLDNAVNSVIAAQTISQPVPAATQPNWIRNDKNLLKYFDRALRDPEGFKSQFYQYESLGPLGIPRLTIDDPVEYSIDKRVKGKTSLFAQEVGFAQRACVCLDIEAKQAGAWGPECKITKFLKMPEGKLVKNTEPYAREGDYWYTPPRIGTDTAHFILENGAGKQVEVIFKIQASRYAGGSIEADTKLAELGQDDTFAGWLSDTPFTLTSTTISFSNLAGAAVGQTTDNAIRLDTDAADHGLFIDSTPADNSEFLPTSNPNEWIAKAGSDAAGKMDMLSVLLHEYGHALGIAHSSDANDFMGATLTPGVRRLPGTDELALMARLVGEIKSGSNDAPDTPQSPSLPVRCQRQDRSEHRS